LIELSIGNVKGSILGPIFYAIFTSPLFELTNLSNFYKDIHDVIWNRSIKQFGLDHALILKVRIMTMGSSAPMDSLYIYIYIYIYIR
jgi:hypothetical protein